MSIVFAVLFSSIFFILIMRFLRGRLILDGSALLFGLAVYVLLPFAVYGLNFYTDGPGEVIWINEFRHLYEDGYLVLLIVLINVIGFILGNNLSVPAFGRFLNIPPSLVAIRVFLVLLLILWSFYLSRAWGMVGFGYGIEYDQERMGPLGTINLVSVLLLLNALEWGGRRSHIVVLAIMLTLNSIVLLSMGGRMYVLIPVVCLLLQRINSGQILFMQRLKLIISITLVFCFLAFIGVWRLGVDFDLVVLLKTALAEPVLTSISFASYVQCSGMSALEIPYNFFGSFLNLMPTIIFPEKANWIPELDSSGCVFSPFGATHIGAALLANFGIVGGFLYMFLLGFMLKMFRKIKHTGWWLYYYVCAALPFTFFRDGFLIFNKVLLTGVVTALVLYGFTPIFLGRMVNKRISG